MFLNSWKYILTSPKTQLIQGRGYVSLVIDNPSLDPVDRIRIAEMVEYADAACWRLNDIRLCEYPVLSKYGCSISGETYHSSYSPKTDEEREVVRTMLREYWEAEDGSIHWCTFDGVVRGHADVDGYKPKTYLNFDQAGFFSYKEAMAKLLEIKSFWDSYQGNFTDAKILNPHKQPNLIELTCALTLQKRAPRVRKLI